MGQAKKRAAAIAKLKVGASVLTIKDVRCVDCRGAVELFAIPDAVWDGLGYALGDYACMSCVYHRLGTPKHDDMDDMQEEITRQRLRFGLSENENESMGVPLPEGRFVVIFNSDEMTSVPYAATISNRISSSERAKIRTKIRAEMGIQ
jgi:hypothetical protein